MALHDALVSRNIFKKGLHEILLTYYTSTHEPASLCCCLAVLTTVYIALKGGKNNTRNPAQSSRFSIAVIRVFCKFYGGTSQSDKKNSEERGDVLLSLHVHITHFKQLALQIHSAVRTLYFSAEQNICSML